MELLDFRNLWSVQISGIQVMESMDYMHAKEAMQVLKTIGSMESIEASANISILVAFGVLQAFAPVLGMALPSPCTSKI